jgi:hypothetical protein
MIKAAAEKQKKEFILSSFTDSFPLKRGIDHEWRGE